MSNFPKINYIGNKSAIVDKILKQIQNEDKNLTIMDLFGGSGVSFLSFQKK
ncbi:DNA adenine methylase [Spiroplasma endosymbiont of Nebria brevicollis]|uniref:DNA adenine methylase n=1 Tax=Spiroplasma endosymbiont of Nebria brevicollis TaxID=3066284 RepID=UPI00313CEB8D